MSFIRRNTTELRIYVEAEDDSISGNGADIYIYLYSYNENLWFPYKIGEIGWRKSDYGKTLTIVNDNGAPRVQGAINSNGHPLYAWDPVGNMLGFGSNEVLIESHSNDYTIVYAVRYSHGIKDSGHLIEITSNGSGDNTTKNPDLVDHQHWTIGGDVTIEANTPPGLEFMGWSGDVESISVVETISPWHHFYITANFIDNTPPNPPLSLFADPNTWTTNNRFEIDWTNPEDNSDIAGAYFKLGAEPVSNMDYSGYRQEKPFTIGASQEGGQKIYVWLKDKFGNTDCQNNSSVVLYYSTNSTTSLSWTGEPNYELDGIHPDTGNTDSTFTWRIKYTDQEGDAPALGYPKLHILENGVEMVDSPFSMNYLSGTFSTGAIYEYSKQIAAGTNYSYYFEAEDLNNNEASGIPTIQLNAPDVSDASGEINTSPSISWTGEANYTSDGMNPESGDTTTTFTWRVKYTDADGDAPASGYPKVIIDRAGTGWTYSMTRVAGDYRSGAIYSFSKKLYKGSWKYKFVAKDAGDAVASGSPTSWINAPEVNDPPPVQHAPSLREGSLYPQVGSISSGFTFLTYYSDPDEDIPMTGYPKVHILDNNVDIPGSPFTMSFFPGGISQPYAGDYRFETQLEVGTNYTYYFEAKDTPGNTTTTVAQAGPIVTEPLFDNMTVQAGLNGANGRSFSYGDYDDDGDLDLYFADNGVNQLYRNEGDGTFLNVTVAADVGDNSGSSATVFVDYDNDGDLDLYVGNDGPNVMFRNNGDGTFSDVTSSVQVSNDMDARCISVSDYNRDGMVDIYVSNWDSFGQGGGADVLYRNNNCISFSDVTTSSGIQYQSFTHGSAFGDYNNDRNVDLYVAHYDGSFLYKNNGNWTFTDVAVAASVDNSSNDGICAAWGDYDNDGFLDLYVVNWGYDKLFHNNGNGTFTDVSATALGSGLKTAGIGTNVVFGDYNNDGDLDIFVSGYLEGSNALYVNNGDGTFNEIADSAGIAGSSQSTYGIFLDYDNDGSLDILTTPNTLYRNRGGENNWLAVKLTGVLSNSYGVGTRIELQVNGKNQVRMLDGKDNLYAHFGLANETEAEELIIKWHNGITQRFYNVSANQILEIKEALPPDIQAVSPNTGSTAGGRTLYVSGSNFVNGATVFVGGNEATDVEYLDSTKISAKTPEGAIGAKDVKIKNPDGQTDILSLGYAYETPRILFVDDDALDEDCFIEALDSNNYVYDVLNVEGQGSPTSEILGNYDIVIWTTGQDYSDTLTSSDQDLLSSYLETGGKLFLSSQDLLYDIGESSTFDEEVLRVLSYTNDVKQTSAIGTNGDPISDGENLSLAFSNVNGSDEIMPTSDASAIFTGNKGICGLRHSADNCKVVFLAFPFEAISEDVVRDRIMDNILRWLNSSAGIEISGVDGLVELTEDGTTDTYSVVLNCEPTANVTVNLTSDSQMTVSPPTLTFTPGNWNVPQTVIVSAIDDDIAEGNFAGSVSHRISSGDLFYDNINVPNVYASIADNDSAGITIVETGGSTNVTEGGVTDTYTVALTSEPLAGVEITITPNSQVTVSSTSLTFTSGNWDTAQTVTVTAVDDAVDEDNLDDALYHTSSSNDQNYKGIIRGLAFTVDDNDSAGITIVETGGSTNVTEGGVTDTYTVALTSEPLAGVEITITPNSQVTVSSTSLTFTSGNWDTAQTVTVTAVDDAVDEDNHIGSITHSSWSTDTDYRDLTIGDVNVSITDNNDIDNDGMPNDWENQYNLNPNDNSDAGSDNDEDGLTNLQEYTNGTKPNDTDSDDDLMPDGWEITYNLDPAVNDATADADNDGISNLEEYQAGSDPTEAASPSVEACRDINADITDPKTITLDCTASHPGGKKINHYEWLIFEYPAGSNAVITDADTTTPDAQITPDVTGTYKLEVTVTDENNKTAKDTMLINAYKESENVPPTADAGIDRTAITGDERQLELRFSDN